jgi:hypothetical protein
MWFLFCTIRGLGWFYFTARWFLWCVGSFCSLYTKSDTRDRYWVEALALCYVGPEGLDADDGRALKFAVNNVT